MAELNIDESVRERVLSAKTPQEALSVLSEEGLEIPDELLDAVAGGAKSPMGSTICGGTSDTLRRFLARIDGFDPSAFLVALSDCMCKLPAGVASLPNTVASSIPGALASISGAVGEE